MFFAMVGRIPASYEGKRVSMSTQKKKPQLTLKEKRAQKREKADPTPRARKK
ncbi:hypothetical protein GCM10023171_30490 [Microbacterium panaciterrae]|uniref:Uncharacterized protein n=1 Tax=Microbacterium panaciterrae TaxID=985759 RepID=A0ABP8PPP1_9MICO